MNLFSAHQLCRYSRSGEVLLKQVSFALKQGQCLGVFGKSGSGKTLLLRSLAGLDPLDSGQILLQRKSLQAYAMPEYRSKVMYLAQAPRFHKGSVQENLDTPRNFQVYHHTNSLKPLKNHQEHFKSLGLSADLAQKNIQQLSGGERQKIAFIRAIQLNPTILLLDEPTAAMDPESSQQFETLIQKWLKNSDKACVWISHHQEQLAKMADQIYQMSEQSLLQTL